MNYFNGFGKSDDKKNRNSVIDDKINILRLFWWAYMVGKIAVYYKAKPLRKYVLTIHYYIVWKLTFLHWK